MGLGALRSAVARGHSVSMITTPDLASFFRDDPENPILDKVNVETIDDYTDTDALTEAVQRIHQRYPIDAGIPIFSASAWPLTEACARLGIRSTSAKATHLAGAKFACRQRLAERGICDLPCMLAESAADALDFASRYGFPIVLKPNRGLGSIAAKVVSTPEEIEEYYRDYNNLLSSLTGGLRQEFSADGRIIAEAFLDGTLCSAEVAVASDGFKLLALSRRKRSGTTDINELGSTMPGVTDPDSVAHIHDYVASVIDALGFDRGIFHVELILDADEKPSLLEVNPRLMGGTLPLLYKSLTGADVYDILIDTFLDKPMGPPPAMTASVASRVLGARERATARADLDDNWQAAFAADTVFCDIPLQKGQTVERLDHNLCSFGMFAVSAATPEEADAKADRLLKQMEKVIGIPLCH
ncbi:ATP-grasp domain-containing protein [Stappia indica]|uniref:ATP-grasp domain-containing protein n=1 Tax=Stappia indica TaxID=538381 RepID=UPI001CD6F8DA|nr:ATP-grasp domain-containing protein [Stappia indica]MCA1298593.1 ATP-grasp domain-containing protein [Stappia indica]